MRLSNKQFREKMQARRPIIKVRVGVIGDTMYDLYSDGSIRNPVKIEVSDEGPSIPLPVRDQGNTELGEGDVRPESVPPTDNSVE